MNKISCAQACYASKVKRFFGGFIIDRLMIELPVFLAFKYYVLDKFPVLQQDFDIYRMYGLNAPAGMDMPTYGDYAESIVAMAVLLVYYFIMESICARTVAKYMLGTVVVDKNGNKPSVWRMLLRTLCRLIPFDAVSYLFASWYNGKLYGAWHDKLSGTYVVDANLLAQWKDGSYDGTDRFAAFIKDMMEKNGMTAEDIRVDDQDEDGREPGRLRVEDLYPSDDVDEQDDNI